MPGTYRFMQVDEAGADFHLVEQPTPEPGRGQVRIAVEANGICHSDAMILGGYVPGTTFPCVAGHEEARLEDAGEAFAKMLSGEARFRMVLTTGQ